MNYHCKDCIFFESGQWDGDCKRHAPQVRWHQARDESEVSYEATSWPKTNKNDFCGEWQGVDGETIPKARPSILTEIYDKLCDIDAFQRDTNFGRK